jgi:hypothetical protein
MASAMSSSMLARTTALPSFCSNTMTALTALRSALVSASTGLISAQSLSPMDTRTMIPFVLRRDDD